MTSTEVFLSFYRVRLSHVLTEYGYVTALVVRVR